MPRRWIRAVWASDADAALVVAHGPSDTGVRRNSPNRASSSKKLSNTPLPIHLSVFTREDQNEAIESVLNTYAVRYGDDYAALGWGASPPASRSSSRRSPWRGRRTATCLKRRHPIRPALRPGSPTSVQRRTRWRLASLTCSCTWAATSQGDPCNGHYYPGSV